MRAAANVGSGQTIAALDAMRGYAASVVVLFHMMWFFAHQLPVEAGFLAVDLFFLMSGLVIEKSYGPALRDGSMTIAGFVRKRWLRLYPLYLLAGLLGCISYLRHAPKLSAAFSSAASLATMLPQAAFGSDNALFAFNNPSWSLCIEMFGGIVFAGLGPRLGTRGMLGIALGSFGILTYGVIRHQTLHLGPDLATLGYGISRFGFSYPVGMLIWRHRDLFPKLGQCAPVLIIVALCFPWLPASNMLRLAWIALIMPAGITATLQWSVPGPAQRWCRILGRVSYPIYILHVPVLGLAVGGLSKVWGQRVWGDPTAGMIALLAIAAFSSAVAYLVEPHLRGWFDLAMRHLGWSERPGRP